MSPLECVLFLNKKSSDRKGNAIRKCCHSISSDDPLFFSSVNVPKTTRNSIAFFEFPSVFRAVPGFVFIRFHGFYQKADNLWTLFRQIADCTDSVHDFCNISRHHNGIKVSFRVRRRILKTLLSSLDVWDFFRSRNK